MTHDIIYKYYLDFRPENKSQITKIIFDLDYPISENLNKKLNVEYWNFDLDYALSKDTLKQLKKVCLSISCSVYGFIEDTEENINWNKGDN